MNEGPVEGWYDDPRGEPALRYWDGEAWTDDILPTPSKEPQPLETEDSSVDSSTEEEGGARRQVVRVTRDSDKKLALARGGLTSWLYGDVRRYDREVDGDTVRYVVDTSEAPPTVIFVSAADEASLSILDALQAKHDPDKVAAALHTLRESRRSHWKPEPTLHLPGRFEINGSVATIMLGDDRHDLVVGSDPLPAIRGQDRTDDGGLAVELTMPGTKRPIIIDVASDDAALSQRALAVIKASSAPEKGLSGSRERWEYKVIRNMTANRLEESLNTLGAHGWELVAMAGLDGVVSITGNKLYAVLKRRR